MFYFYSLFMQGINNIASISLTGNVSEAPSAPTVAPPVTLAQRAAGQRPLATNALVSITFLLYYYVFVGCDILLCHDDLLMIQALLSSLFARSYIHVSY